MKLKLNMGHYRFGIAYLIISSIGLTNGSPSANILWEDSRDFENLLRKILLSNSSISDGEGFY